MQAKTKRAFRTISEASEELDLQAHVLRFWESKFPDIKPIKRGGGRRFYRPADIEFLRGIKILLHDEKHPIKDVQKLIRIKGAERVAELGRSVQRIEMDQDISLTDLVPKRIKKESPKTAQSDKDHSDLPRSDSTEIVSDARPISDDIGQSENKAMQGLEAYKPKIGSDDDIEGGRLSNKDKAAPTGLSSPETMANIEIKAGAIGENHDNPYQISPEERSNLEVALVQLRALRAQWEKFQQS